MVENRIKETREALGMTQDDLSKSTGISRTIISALEMNKKEDCKISTLFAIAKALGKPVCDIFLLS